jgi:hypothetical protein
VNTYRYFKFICIPLYINRKIFYVFIFIIFVFYTQNMTIENHKILTEILQENLEKLEERALFLMNFELEVNPEEEKQVANRIAVINEFLYGVHRKSETF